MKDLDLIKQAALKWWGIMKRNGYDEGPRNCALCQKYNIAFACIGCPVYEFISDGNGCNATPYRDWAVHVEFENRELQRDPKPSYNIICHECYVLAREEFLFLCRLYRSAHYNNAFTEKLKEEVSEKVAAALTDYTRMMIRGGINK